MSGLSIGPYPEKKLFNGLAFNKPGDVFMVAQDSKVLSPCVQAKEDVLLTSRQAVGLLNFRRAALKKPCPSPCKPDKAHRHFIDTRDLQSKLTNRSQGQTLLERA